LEKFEIFDDAGVASPHGTLYEKIAENVDADEQVFDVKVTLFDHVDPGLDSKHMSLFPFSTSFIFQTTSWILMLLTSLLHSNLAAFDSYF